ncbi:MAG: nitrate reductase molybdenum cofactor assembly chaperone [Betaproteobacteria bacterium RIFCSPLOWO2_12_FULL_68_19]|nr:MAG: nitrate reductase molybdenum cofactor assembly chaperone [Betaproteobacteria bacterium RIFCSPLOWO2_12_FULL_68_19]
MSYRALAALLAYPEGELIDALPEIRAALSPQRDLAALLDEMRREPLTALQERYVALFDRSRALSLHLFEHVHGESRDRGQAMVDLAQTYASRGFAVAGNELPDYLPAFLEFLSVLPREEARGMIGEAAEILRALGDRLAERGSRYAAVFAALLAAGGEAGLTRPLAARPTTGEESSPAAIDKAWMDEPVTFGGPQPVKFYGKGARP